MLCFVLFCFLFVCFCLCFVSEANYIVTNSSDILLLLLLFCFCLFVYVLFLRHTIVTNSTMTYCNSHPYSLFILLTFLTSIVNFNWVNLIGSSVWNKYSRCLRFKVVYAYGGVMDIDWISPVWMMECDREYSWNTITCIKHAIWQQSYYIYNEFMYLPLHSSNQYKCFLCRVYYLDYVVKYKSIT